MRRDQRVGNRTSWRPQSGAGRQVSLFLCISLSYYFHLCLVSSSCSSGGGQGGLCAQECGVAAVVTQQASWKGYQNSSLQSEARTEPRTVWHNYCLLPAPRRRVAREPACARTAARAGGCPGPRRRRASFPKLRLYHLKQVQPLGSVKKGFVPSGLKTKLESDTAVGRVKKSKRVKQVSAQKMQDRAVSSTRS